MTLRDNVISISEWRRYEEQVWHLKGNLDFVGVQQNFCGFAPRGRRLWGRGWGPSVCPLSPVCGAL